MAEEMKGTNISSPVVPFTKDDRYATHDETFGRGGYRSVASVSEMNAIPNERRKEGMLVNVVGDKIYKLSGGFFVEAELGNGGGEGTANTDLGLDVRINRDKTTKKQVVQYRIRQYVGNGYICFLRKKKCSNSRADYRRNKYTVPKLSFSNGLEVDAIDVFAIPCNRANLNEWTDFPNFDAYIAGSNTIPNERFYFKGNVHCKPCVFHPATGSANKRTAVLHCGLQYLVLNPNFVNGILENNAKPKDVLMSGDMVKFKVRLQCVNTNNFASGYNLIYSIY